MVLASNEWLTNCDDDQKSAPSNATTATTTNTTGTTSTTTTTTLVIPPITATRNETTTTIAIPNNANNEREIQAGDQERQQPPQLQIANVQHQELSSLKYTNALRIMAENTRKEIEKNKNPKQIELEKITKDIHSTESENNNQAPEEEAAEKEEEEARRQQQQQQQESELTANFLKVALGENVTNANTNSICNITESNSNLANLNSNSNSNTSTLVQQASGIVRQSKSTPIITPQPLSSPITPQALSSALQSVMNSTVTVGIGPPPGLGGNNVQNNFLTSLGIGGGGGGGLPVQQTAKLQQLSSNFEPNFVGVGGGSSNLDAPATATEPVDHSALGNGQAKIILLCETNSHPFQTRTIVLTPNIECKVGRLIAKSKAAESNAIFDCKVLSRNHAVLWYSSDDGKFWVKDTKSSNGTFINESKLGTDAAELHFGDIVKFGVDVLENSRKEVHGCIIACVKLYLPDGREAISIDAAHQQQLQQQRSQYSGEGRISFDELHRLNLYMQEASQRESLLKSKLFNIQNILDATRKNSAVCWQSMIAEDQLLHRIHSLEKKLQIMEKNVPESALRNEVLKLLDDKSSYQHTAKEALRKVYQERCDAMQMLSKMEGAYTTSENECKILRDQIMNTKQSLQDVNSRLLRLETEYNEFKDETERQQQEAKEQEEQRTVELTEKLKQRELDCEELRRKISELLLKRAELLDDEEQLQKQAIEKLDAAIADMDLGDDDDDDDDIDDEDEDADDENNDDANGDSNARHQLEDSPVNEENEANDKKNKKKRQRSTSAIAKERRKKSSSTFDDLKNGGSESVVDAISNSSDSEKEKTDSSPKTAAGGPQMPVKQKVAKESTIMKWLQNSDLNKTAGSLEIFQAICNESDSSDERDDVIEAGDRVGAAGETGAGTNATTNKKFTKFPNKLRNVQKYIKQLETAIANETSTTATTATIATTTSTNLTAAELSNSLATLAIAASMVTDGSAIFAADDDDSEDDDEDEEGDDEFIIKRNGKLNEVLSKGAVPSTDNKNYVLLLKRSVAMLSEAYNEIWDSVQEQLHQQQQQLSQNIKAAIESSPPPAISVQTQFQNYAQHNPSNSAAKKLEPQETLRTLPVEFANEANIITTTTDDDDDEQDSRTTASSVQDTSEDSLLTIETTRENRKLIENEMRGYQQQIAALNDKLEQIENDSQNTLELMQIESDAFKDRVIELTKLIETLREEKEALEAAVSSEHGACTTATAVAVTTEKIKKLTRINEEEGIRADENTDDEEIALKKQHQTEVDNVAAAFELQMREELAALSSGAMQREEELIMYKERLERMQMDNLELRREMQALQQQKGGLLGLVDYTQTAQLKRILPFGALVVAVLVYFITTYF